MALLEDCVTVEVSFEVSYMFKLHPVSYRSHFLVPSDQDIPFLHASLLHAMAIMD